MRSLKLKDLASLYFIPSSIVVLCVKLCTLSNIPVGSENCCSKCDSRRTNKFYIINIKFIINIKTAFYVAKYMRVGRAV